MSTIAVDSRLGRAVGAMARSAWFRRVGPRIAGPMDRVARKVSGGRFVVSGLMVPTLVLSVRGAKSGEVREVPLACLPHDGAFFVVGSNFGRERHPAWTYNLDANPDASVWHAGTVLSVSARRLEGSELEAMWERLVSVWPSYDFYAEHSGRTLRVYRLDPGMQRGRLG